MVKKITFVSILAFLVFHFSSTVVSYKSAVMCYGCNSEYGWPWVYYVKYDGDVIISKGDPTEVFYRNAFIADVIVAIIISVFLILLIAFIIKTMKKRKELKE